MDNVTLKKKLSSYLSVKGQLRNVSDELLFDLLRNWEDWTGTASDFYRTLGFSHRQMAKLLGKAKKLQREGVFGTQGFKEIQLDSEISLPINPSKCPAIELDLKDGKLIRFYQVEHLIEFLKKVA